MSAFITSSSSPKSLIAIRSLGKKGVDITSGDSQPYAFSNYSKYVSRYINYPSPKQNQCEFIGFLSGYIKKHRPDVLIPIHSEDTLLIARYRDKFESHTKVPLHDYPIMIALNDKGALSLIAQELDIPIPQTFIPRNTGEISGIIEKITFPAVIKLRDRTSSTGQMYVNTPDELRYQFKNVIARFALTPDNYPLIQEYIPGEGCGVSFLYNQGDMRAFFTHKRIREYPISGGPSTCRISIRHPKMESLAKRLLDHFSWHGVAMVEFRLTPDGKPVLLEVNPRFWGSVNQAVQSGVDFPYLLYQMAVEGDIKPQYHYREGIVTRNSLLDVMAYVQKIYQDYPIDLRPWLQIPFHDDILTIDDPMPFFAFIRYGRKRLSR